MSSEQTPLLRTVVVVPPKQRYYHNRTRRLITIVLSVGIVVAVVLFLLPASWFPGNRNGVGGELDEPWQPIGNPPRLSTVEGKKRHEALKKLLIDTPSAKKIEENLRYYTAGPHLAGKNLSQAEWTRDLWTSYGIQSEIVSYDVYINYPLDHRLALLRGVSGQPAQIEYECSLEEDVLPEDPTTGLDDRVPIFHGYSANGTATAQYVYVNFGTYQDYADLQAAGVDLKGKIALVKYGRIFRGLKVAFAEQLGMVGVVMYDDPQLDGEFTQQNGYKAYPDGPARNPSAAQRGSVQYLSFGPGDPTTIGYPSKPGVDRQDPNATTPSIPSLPISYTDALPLLRALNGHGPSSKDFNQYWQGGGLDYLGVEYSIGPSPLDLQLHLVNEVEYKVTPIWNVIGILNGTGLADQSVVVGNHRDAWIAGGAGDPNSGSAALNEVIRSFGKASEQGWRPERTMVFASWDGEEYGLLGSTEWVEEYIPWLAAGTMAYLNVDVGYAGPHFKAAAAPLTNEVVKSAAAAVLSPNQTITGQTVYDVWKQHDGKVSTLGSGSDYTAFLDFAGISSIDIGFNGGDEAVYHYHSNYDSMHWMENFGDPGFKHLVAMAQILAVIAADLADKPVIPFSAVDYVDGLKSYLASAEARMHNKSQSVTSDDEDVSVTRKKHHRGFRRLFHLVDSLHHAAITLDNKAASMASLIDREPKWWYGLRGRVLRRQVAKVNSAYKLMERAFVYDEGLDNRSWFKHVVFAPGKYTGYAGATFPGLIEGIDDGNLSAVEKWEEIIAGRLTAAKKAIDLDDDES